MSEDFRLSILISNFFVPPVKNQEPMARTKKTPRNKYQEPKPVRKAF